jgi:hypothetical protein
VSSSVGVARLRTILGLDEDGACGLTPRSTGRNPGGRVRFVIPEWYHHAAYSIEPEPDYRSSPFQVPTDFSKVCRFPRDYLLLHSEEGPGMIPLSDDEIEPFCLADAQKEMSSSISPRRRVDSRDDLEDFLAIETRLEEEDWDDGQLLPNFEVVLECVERKIKENSFKKRIRDVLCENRQAHFVLLLLEPGLSVEGVYTLDPGLQSSVRIWGDTPDTVAKDDPVRFWVYNVALKEFVEQREKAFSSFTDAVSM